MSTILVTGGNRGIGLALVRRYLSNGWTVIATCRDPAGAEALQAERANGTLEIETLDVADPQSIAALADRIGSRPIDMLVNNAGVYWRTGALSGLPADAWGQTFATNVMGPVELSLALLPALRAGSKRTVINITSALGSIAETSGGSYAYRASKAALNMAMRSLAIDLKAEGFIVLQQSPGLVDTDLARDVPRGKISPEESVAGMGAVFDGLMPADNGSFRRHTGETLQW